MEKNLRENHTTRPAKKEDLNALLAMLTDLVRHEGLEDRFQMTNERLETELFGEHADWHGLVATDLQDAPVGFCLYSRININRSFNNSPLLQMDHLYVKPEWRKSGIGQSLLLHLAQVAKEQGVGRINAWCMKGNEQGQNFYRKIKAEKRDFVDIYSLQINNFLEISL